MERESLKSTLIKVKAFSGEDAINVYQMSKERFPNGKFAYSYNPNYKKNRDAFLDDISAHKRMGDRYVCTIEHTNLHFTEPLEALLNGLEGKSIDLKPEMIPFAVIPKREGAE